MKEVNAMNQLGLSDHQETRLIVPPQVKVYKRAFMSHRESAHERGHIHSETMETFHELTLKAEHPQVQRLA